MGTGQDIDKPGKHNQKGFWEHKGIQEINNEVMSRLGYNCLHHGADWIDPPTFPDNWETDSQFTDLKDRANTLIQQDFSDYAIWGWKDPRTCFTLPFWQSILPEIDYVILIRNPVDVARSLERFICIGCTFERGLYLWSLHLRYAFKYTTGKRRILINVEDWTKDWKKELSQLVDFIGKPALANDTDIQTDIYKHIDKGLWHSTSSRAVSTVSNMYEQLLAQNVSLESEPTSIFSDNIDTLAAEAQSSDADKALRDKSLWEKQLTQAINMLSKWIPDSSNLILIDDNLIGADSLHRRGVKLFMERDGVYYGCPSDSDEAIEEFKRLHTAGAEYCVFTWSAFWWLEYYPEFQQYLRSRFRCILHDETLVVFDLQPC